MVIKRKLVRIDTPPGQQGFLGPDHTARAVIQTEYSESDPFIMLMDDVLDKKNNDPVGGPHPHGGFETVTLIVEGEMGDESDKMSAGDFQIMTAGSGIIHTEAIKEKTFVRILQLWLNLPKQQRWVEPRVQNYSHDRVPVASGEGLNIKIYSGSLSGVSSPISNYTPLIVAEINLKGGISTTQLIPANFTTFLYVLKGSVSVGDDEKVVGTNQVGWLDKYSEKEQSELKLTAGDSGARVILYSGQPQGDPIVSHGPFIGDNQQDIIRLYDDYRHGKLQHISSVAEGQQVKL
jgi:redox-sensitive bicupin YhaK (pirin superfamily)